MFDPAEETERDWHVELREDVRAEVQEKYGDVVDIFLIKESAVRGVSVGHGSELIFEARARSTSSLRRRKARPRRWLVSMAAFCQSLNPARLYS
jgi:hypothetical protein